MASCVFVAVGLGRGWQELEPHLDELRPGPLAFGQMWVLAALLMGGVSWALLQRALGLGAGWGEATANHFVSGITKYLPGYAWQYLSKGYLSRGHGAAPKQIAVALLTEFVLLMAAGLVTMAPAAVLADPGWRLSELVPGWGWACAAVVALMGTVYWTVFVTRQLPAPSRARARQLLWFAFALSSAGWLMFAAAAWCFSRSLANVPVSAFPQHIVALNASVILGILVFVIPVGLGIRESALSLLLVGVLPLELGIAVSLLVRLGVVAGELLAFALALGAGRARGMSVRQMLSGHE